MILFAIAALLLPGLLVSGLVPCPQRDPLCWLATLLCAALGSWITLFWVIRIVPLSLTQLFAVVAGAALVGVVVRRRVLLDLVTKRLDWRGPHALALVTLRLGIPVLLGIGAALHLWDFYLSGYRWVSVTENDLQVIAWVEQNVPAAAVIENNYGDAGIWIPALAGRAVLHPHVNVVYLDDIKAWQDRTQPRFGFVGEHRVYTDGPYGPDTALDPTDTAERFRRGGAAIYERNVP